jgi:6-phosphogluconolactonase
MKKISPTLATLILAASLGAAPATAKTFIYVSNADDGDISGFALNPATGALTALGRTPAGMSVMPMAVSPDKKYLYAVVRSKPFTLVTFAVDPATGALTRKAAAPLADSCPYVSVDATGRWLFTASYSGNKVAVNPIAASGLVEEGPSQVIPTGIAAHCIRPEASNKYVYASNLGSNQVLMFRFDAKTGTLTPNDPPLIKAHPGNGPRHIIFSPDQKFMYVIHELTGNIAQFAINHANGTLKEVGFTATVPVDAGLQPGLMPPPPGVTLPVDTIPRAWGADIQITPNGKFVYATERTRSRVILLKVAPGTGNLTYVTEYPTETQPRGLGIDPTGTYLMASGEKSDRLSVYRIDQAAGTLTLLDRYPVGKDANWVQIVDLP